MNFDVLQNAWLAAAHSVFRCSVTPISSSRVFVLSTASLVSSSTTSIRRNTIMDSMTSRYLPRI